MQYTSIGGPKDRLDTITDRLNIGRADPHNPHDITTDGMAALLTALIEFAESRGVSRHPESTLTARLEAAAFGGGK